MNRKRRRSFFRDAVTADWLRRGMRVPFILASVMCSLAWADGGEVPVKKSQGRKLGLSIQVQGGWGRGRKESIETVLNAVADELLPRLPSGLTAPIVVTHTDGPPMALYGRGPGGEFRIRLHARDENWHLYAYEFAHELCHVMSNHDAHPAGSPPRRDNQWFEETLCETASLFTLRHLAQRWATEPPGPEWAGEADRLRRPIPDIVRIMGSLVLASVHPVDALSPASTPEDLVDLLLHGVLADGPTPHVSATHASSTDETHLTVPLREGPASCSAHAAYLDR